MIEDKIIGAICDDESMSLKMVASALVSCFKDNGVDLMLDEFTSASEFLESAEKNAYSVVFLDIDMPGIDGIETAVKLKELSNKTNIIFVSNCEDRVFDTFIVHPFGFVRKSSFLKDVQAVVTTYLASIKSDNTASLNIKTSEGVLNIPISDVIYIECAKDNQLIYLSDNKGSIKVRFRMQELEKRLSKYGFMRIHQGYIVNYKYIKKISTGIVELKNGTSLPVSRSKRQNIFVDYVRLCRKENIDSII